MKNTIFIGLFLLNGCAGIQRSENEFYHRFAAKPTIVEKSLGNGQWQETALNPYEVPIVATIDCDNEQNKRIVTVKANKDTSFKTTSDTDHNCSVFEWQVE